MPIERAVILTVAQREMAFGFSPIATISGLGAGAPAAVGTLLGDAVALERTVGPTLGTLVLAGSAAGVSRKASQRASTAERSARGSTDTNSWCNAIWICEPLGMKLALHPGPRRKAES